MNPYGLVNVQDSCPGVIVDMRYATDRNFFKARLYDGDGAWLLAGAARKLAVAAGRAAERGYRMVVLDAYRPLSAQARMWDIMPDEAFVAPVSRGSNHNRGAAVDVTLADLAGRELPMPSDFDEFSERASHLYAGGDPEALARRDALRSFMEEAGFRPYDAEWWHYTDPGSKAGPLIDAPLSELGGAPRPSGPARISDLYSVES